MADNRCAHCDEPIDGECREIPHLGDDGSWTLRSWHPECVMRNIVGGVNHLRGHCTCCGGVDPPDPPWLSRREAAQAAVAEYRARQ